MYSVHVLRSVRDLGFAMWPYQSVDFGLECLGFKWVWASGLKELLGVYRFQHHGLGSVLRAFEFR